MWMDRERLSPVGVLLWIWRKHWTLKGKYFTSIQNSVIFNEKLNNDLTNRAETPKESITAAITHFVPLPRRKDGATTTKHGVKSISHTTLCCDTIRSQKLCRVGWGQVSVWIRDLQGTSSCYKKGSWQFIRWLSSLWVTTEPATQNGN